MTLESICAMPTSGAWYCEGCRAITNRPQCAYCASVIVYPLEKLLDGKPEEGEQKQ
jgi:hypothetical protein